MKKKILPILLISGLFYSQSVKVDQPVSTQIFNIINSSDIASTNPGDVTTRGIFVADEFTLTERIKVGKVKFYGQGEPNFVNDLVKVQVNIYKDNFGIPAGIPLKNNTGQVIGAGVSKGSSELNIVDLGNNIYTIEVDLSNWMFPLYLESNTKYWANINPYVLKNDNFFAQSNWYAFPANLIGQESKFIDPWDLMMGSYTSWTNTSNIVSQIKGIAFTIEGVTALGTNEAVSNFKKITLRNTYVDNEIVLDNKFNEKILSTSILDASGKLVSSFNTLQRDVSNLPAGKYFLVVQIQNGEKINLNFVKK